MKKNNIAILIVSYNRRDFVLKNIEAIKKLTFKEYDVLLFDNGSSDNTLESVEQLHEHVTIFRSKENLGGAGGFASGLKIAYSSGYEYIWCLDDDGFPKEDALSILMEEIVKKNKIAIFGTHIIPIKEDVNVTKHFWPIHGKFDKNKKEIVEFTNSQKKQIIESELTFETASVALLGMLISRDVIEKIGYPLSDLFISNDDVEYCLRAWVNNIPVILVQKSILYHPANSTISVNLGFKKIEISVMAPWKLYYYVRNSIYVSKKYFSMTIYLKFILISFFIILHSFLNNKGAKKLTIKAGIMALYHGLIGKIGKFNLN